MYVSDISRVPKYTPLANIRFNKTVFSADSLLVTCSSRVRCSWLRVTRKAFSA